MCVCALSLSWRYTIGPIDKKRWEDSNQYIRVEKGNRRMSNTDTQIVRNHYKKLYANKLKTPEEIHRYLDIYNLTEIESWWHRKPKYQITKADIESLINTLPNNIGPRPDSFIDEFYQTFEETLVPILFKLLKTAERERILPNSLYGVSITLIPKILTDKQRKTSIDKQLWWTQL